VFADGKLTFARSYLSQATQGAPDAILSGIFASLNTHFHLGFTFPLSGKEALLLVRQRVGQLIGTYRLIMSVLARADSFFDEDLSDNTAFAKAKLGGLNNGGKISFCPPYLTLGPKFRTAVIVHEGAHFVDASIGHFASELPAPNGSPVGASTKNYAQLSFDEAARNAYSYAQFALHSFESFDHRLNFPGD
jgi:hypothetical protein